ncbi:DMT family transporter [Ferrovibrio sp.]|uniref:DMT family transporter n=1 Tax=Ferrovibrio sp. TaxID=1917215 RepID=UPI0025BB69F1|nr:DMT family transporter [Ferrovibrio sp.]MBX3454432.1 EamA family transporter [Ferrovibrio sp.]
MSGTVPKAGWETGGNAALLAPLGLCVTALLWGGMIPISHSLVHQVYNPVFLATLRYIAPLPVLLAMCLAFERRWPFSRDLPWPQLLWLGLSMAIFSLLFAYGVLLSEPVRAAIVMSSNPLLATILAKAMYRTPLVRGFWPALVAAIIGGAMVALDAAGPRRAAAGGPPVPYLGEMMLITANLVWVWYSLKAQQWLVPRRMSQLRISLLTTFTGCLVMLAVLAVMEPVSPGRLPQSWPDGGTVLMILWMGVGAAGIAMALWNYGVSRVGVPVASIYGNLAPVFSVAIATMMFGASLSLQQLFGGAVILGGIVMMQWQQLRR